MFIPYLVKHMLSSILLCRTSKSCAWIFNQKDLHMGCIRRREDQYASAMVH